MTAFASSTGASGADFATHQASSANLTLHAQGNTWSAANLVFHDRQWSAANLTLQHDTWSAANLSLSGETWSAANLTLHEPWSEANLTLHHDTWSAANLQTQQHDEQRRQELEAQEQRQRWEQAQREQEQNQQNTWEQVQRTIVTNNNTATESSDAIRVTYNGIPIPVTQPAVLNNGIVFVPVRTIFEAMGATTHWDEMTHTLLVYRDNNVIMLHADCPILFKNGNPTRLEANTRLLNSQLMAPLTVIAESFPSDVTWVQRSNTVEIIGGERQFADGERSVALTTQTTTPVFTPSSDVVLIREGAAPINNQGHSGNTRFIIQNTGEMAIIQDLLQNRNFDMEMINNTGDTSWVAGQSYEVAVFNVQNGNIIIHFGEQIYVIGYGQRLEING
jgi:hypothetical protein